MLASLPQHKIGGQGRLTRGIWFYLASLSVFSVGLMLSAWYFPGGFDWTYTVASALASQKHNPQGSLWFAAALGLAMILLWPYVSALSRNIERTHTFATAAAIVSLRIGLICGALMGLERLLIRDLSAWVYKAHEALGILTFFGLYIGILLLFALAMLRRKGFVLPILLITSPLLAVGITQFWLYLEQRDLGWVDTSWKAMGVPFWFSFAFWQWLAIGLLWAGLGLLAIATVNHRRSSTDDR